jgi:hypothetical protein
MAASYRILCLWGLAIALADSAHGQTYRPNSPESRIAAALAGHGILTGDTNKATWPKQFPLTHLRNQGNLEIYRSSCIHEPGVDKSTLLSKCMYPAFDSKSGRLEYVEIAAGPRQKVRWLPNGSFEVLGTVVSDPQATYKTHCAMCHTTGIANAPRLGDKAAWAARVDTGRESLIEVTRQGKGAMPPTPMSVSDEDLGAVVDYMIGAAR